MKTSTLFRIYKRCKMHQENIINARPRRQFFIATESDEYALRWQRHERLVLKLEHRINKQLEARND